MPHDDLTPPQNSPFFHEIAARRISWSGVTICGVGSLGANIAEMLARMGCPEMTLIDFDTVDARNLSCQPYTYIDIGKRKVDALALHLYRAVETKAIPILRKITTQNVATTLSSTHVIVDCLDNVEGRQAIHGYAASLGHLGTVHVGFSGDGLYGSVQWEPEYTVPAPSRGDPCDYPLTRPLALTLASVAAESIVRYMQTFARENYEVLWGDLAITPAR